MQSSKQDQPVSREGPWPAAQLTNFGVFRPRVYSLTVWDLWGS